jgi:hypothetical protein
VEMGEGFRDSTMVRSGEVDFGSGIGNGFRFLRGTECCWGDISISSALRFVSSADPVRSIETRRGGAFARSSVMATAAIMAMRSCASVSSAGLQEAGDSVDTAALVSSGCCCWWCWERGELKAGTVAPEGGTSGGSSESLG